MVGEKTKERFVVSGIVHPAEEGRGENHRGYFLRTVEYPEAAATFVGKAVHDEHQYASRIGTVVASSVSQQGDLVAELELDLETEGGRRVREKVMKGEYKGLSFGSRSGTIDVGHSVQVLDLDLFEISVVADGAIPGSEIYAWEDGENRTVVSNREVTIVGASAGGVGDDAAATPPVPTKIRMWPVSVKVVGASASLSSSTETTSSTTSPSSSAPVAVIQTLSTATATPTATPSPPVALPPAPLVSAVPLPSVHHNNTTQRRMSDPEMSTPAPVASSPAVPAVTSPPPAAATTMTQPPPPVAAAASSIVAPPVASAPLVAPTPPSVTSLPLAAVAATLPAELQDMSDEEKQMLVDSLKATREARAKAAAAAEEERKKQAEERVAHISQAFAGSPELHTPANQAAIDRVFANIHSNRPQEPNDAAFLGQLTEVVTAASMKRQLQGFAEAQAAIAAENVGRFNTEAEKRAATAEAEIVRLRAELATFNTYGSVGASAAAAPAAVVPTTHSVPPQFTYGYHANLLKSGGGSSSTSMMPPPPPPGVGMGSASATPPPPAGLDASRSVLTVGASKRGRFDDGASAMAAEPFNPHMMPPAPFYEGGNIKKRPLCDPYTNEMCPTEGSDHQKRWTKTVIVGASANAKNSAGPGEDFFVPRGPRVALAIKTVGASASASGTGPTHKNMSGANHPGNEFLRPTMYATIPELVPLIRETPCSGRQTMVLGYKELFTSVNNYLNSDNKTRPLGELGADRLWADMLSP